MFGLKKLFSKEPEKEQESVKSAVASPPAAPAATAIPTISSGPRATISLPLKSFSRSGAAAGYGNVDIPLDLILPQLPKGVVKVEWAELQRIAPNFFADRNTPPQTLIELPLAEILRAIKREHIARRPNQTRIQPPSDIADLFGSRGQALSRSDSAPKAVPVAPSIAAPAASAAAPIQMAAPAPSVVNIEPAASNGEGLEVPLKSLVKNWPEAIQQEIQSNNLSGAAVMFQLDSLEQDLKKGKIVVTWRQLASMLKPSPPNINAVSADLSLELPLKAIVPPLLAKRKLARPSSTITIPDNIPSIFTKTGTAAEQPATPTSAPAIKPVGLPLPDPSAPIGLPSINSPAGILKPLEKVEGVLGALVSAHDGLFIAGRLPSHLKPDTVAAFLPQLLSRVQQTFSEMQKADIQILAFSVSDGDWHLARAGKYYLLVITKPGTEFSSAQIKELVEKLAKIT